MRLGLSDRTGFDVGANEFSNFHRKSGGAIFCANPAARRPFGKARVIPMCKALSSKHDVCAKVIKPPIRKESGRPVHNTSCPHVLRHLGGDEAVVAFHGI